MKRYLFIIFLFFVVMFLFADSVWANHNRPNCLGMHGTVQGVNYAGGQIKVSCGGDTGPSGCIGSSVMLSPGQSFHFDNCSCPPYTDGCLKVENVPLSCTAGYNLTCGTNGQVLQKNITLSCPAAPTRTPTPTRTPAGKRSPCPPLGDVNSDGSINQRDVEEYNKYIARITPRDFIEDAQFADTNGDGRFDSADRNDIAQFIAGSISTFLACEQPSPTITPTLTPTATLTPSVTLPPTPTLTLTPTPTRVPGTSPTPILTPTPPTTTSTPPPSATLTPRPPTSTPTSTPFSPAMCKCDGMEATGIFPGAYVSFSAFAKVFGTDVNFAKVKDITFSVYESPENKPNTALRIAQSSPISAQEISKDSSAIRYKSNWNFVFPANVNTSSLYRVTAQINCVKKVAIAPSNVLGEETVRPSFIQNLFAFLRKPLDFVGGLFGGGDSELLSESPSELAIPTQTTNQRKGLQLKTIQPAQVLEKSCSLIKFKFNNQ